MIELLTAIQTKFNATSSLTTQFPNGCYLNLAPNGVTLPVCVFTVVSAAPAYQTTPGKPLNVVRGQFAVFATTDTQALTAAANIKAAFDFTPLTMANDACVLVMRTNELLTRDDEQTWQAVVEYQFWVQEAQA